MVTVRECPNIAGAKAHIAPVLNTPLLLLTTEFKEYQRKWHPRPLYFLFCFVSFVVYIKLFGSKYDRVADGSRILRLNSDENVLDFGC